MLLLYMEFRKNLRLNRSRKKLIKTISHSIYPMLYQLKYIWLNLHKIKIKLPMLCTWSHIKINLELWVQEWEEILNKWLWIGIKRWWLVSFRVYRISAFWFSIIEKKSCLHAQIWKQLRFKILVSIRPGKNLWF